MIKDYMVQNKLTVAVVNVGEGLIVTRIDKKENLKTSFIVTFIAEEW